MNQKSEGKKKEEIENQVEIFFDRKEKKNLLFQEMNEIFIFLLHKKKKTKMFGIGIQSEKKDDNK
jgi:hypothetical protein